jgi:hypothetical protein
MEALRGDLDLMRENFGQKIIDMEKRLDEERKRIENECAKYEQLDQLRSLLQDRSQRGYCRDAQIVGSAARQDQPIFAIICDMLGEMKHRVDVMWTVHVKKD